MRLLLVALLLFATVALAVKKEDFKECAQTSFCRRLRGIAAKQQLTPETFTSPYSLGKPVSSDNSWTFPLSSSLYPEISFELKVDVLDQGIVRIRADEVDSVSPWRRYNETSKWVLDGEPKAGKGVLKSKGGVYTISYGDGLSLEIQAAPMKITQKRDGVATVVFNERALFHMEHYRTREVEEIKTEPEAAADTTEPEADGTAQKPLVVEDEETVEEVKMDRSWFEEEDKDAFEETWKRWRDSKPKGPEGFSIDLSFPGAQHVYGLPEHAAPLSLPATTGEGAYYSEPYRLYNVDIFEYLADSPMSLYGAVPLLHAHSKAGSVGVLNLVASETWVDVKQEDDGIKTHWVSESGIVDVLLLPGPKPADLFEQYASLTGPAQMPPLFATAYHQCRWNYNTQEEVIEVQDEFDKADMPLDVTWLDIEYARDHRYFDWDDKMFPDPVKMLDYVASKGRKMVAIVDPHVKKVDDYRIYKDSKDLDVLIKKADKSNFDGWCWPGSSVWVDFFDPASWDWWTRMFSYKSWPKSTKALHIWNDMNEPSVFDGPEISLPRDAVHAGGWEHRDVHNLNGMLFHNQTQYALTQRDNLRPFVLSRAYFAGSHRFGAVWTGDNLGTWEHLAGESAMFLSNSIAGMSFVGADVGGFFGNPTPEILVRWYQAGAFMPFFRAHAHIDTKRREPYLFEEPIRSHLRSALRLRYSLLPTWYTAFRNAATKGYPVIWPHYAAHPDDEAGYAIDDQYYVGQSGLLFKPVVTEGAIETTVYLPLKEPYYEYLSQRVHSGPGNITIPTPLDTFPLLLEGGHIVASRERVRRSSALMWQDPFTLTIGVASDGNARGELYIDDGETFGYQKGEYVHCDFKLENGVLSSTASKPNAFSKTIAHVGVERIVILGAKKPTSIKASGKPVEYIYDAAHGTQASVLTIKNPGVKIVNSWDIVIS